MKNSFLTFFLIIIVFSSCNSQLDKKRDILRIDTAFKSGNVEQAMTDIENYLAKETNNEYAYTLSGHIYAELNKDSLAFDAYEKALAIKRKTVEAIVGLGIMARKYGNYDEASDYYYQAIEIDPNYAEAYSSLVVINLKRKNFEEAVAMGLKGYELERRDGTIAANLSVAYHYAGDSINREKYFKIAKKNGYRSLEALKQIFSGELTVFD